MSSMLSILKILLSCSAPPEGVPDPMPEPVEPAAVEPVAAKPQLGPIEDDPGDTAEAVAAQLGHIWQVVLDPENEGPVLDTYGHLHQRIVRELVSDEARAEDVLGRLSPDLATHVRRTVQAQGWAQGTVRRARPQLPAWRIVEPAPAEVLQTYYREAERDSGTPWHLLAAVHLIETRMGRLRGVSVAGAQGPMQFMPKTWSAYGEGDVNDNRDAILAAGRYLAAMGAAEDVDGALWAYNRSRRYVDAVRTWSEQMRERPLLYRIFHGWEVYYLTTRGGVRLPPGYVQEVPVDVNDWCAASGSCPD